MKRRPLDSPYMNLSTLFLHIALSDSNEASISRINDNHKKFVKTKNYDDTGNNDDAMNGDDRPIDRLADGR